MKYFFITLACIATCIPSSSYSSEKKDKKSFFSSKSFKKALSLFNKEQKQEKKLSKKPEKHLDATPTCDTAHELLFKQEYLHKYRYQIREHLIDTKQTDKLNLLEKVLAFYELNPQNQCFNLYCSYLKTKEIVEDYNKVQACLKNYSGNPSDTSRLKEQLMLLCETLQAFCKKRGCE